MRANHPDTDAPPEFYAAHDEVFDARPQPDDDSPLEHLLQSLPALLDRLAPPYTLRIETDRLLPPWDVPQDVFSAYAEDPDDEEPHESDVEYEGDEVVEAPAADEPATPWFDPPTGPLEDDTAREWLQATFAAVVTKLDAELGAVFEILRERGLDRTAAWVVTSDAGQSLGEHGYVGPHRPLMYEEIVHLPLIVRLPGGAEAGRRVASFTQPADLDAFDLMALVRGESQREFARTVMPDGAAAIRTAEWALIVPPPGRGEPQLFEKPDDRWEVNDLYARNVEIADELAAKLKDAAG